MKRLLPRKPLAAALVVALAMLGLGTLGALGWALHAELRARNGARDFCAGIRPGEPEAALAQRALAAGADPAGTRWVQPLVGPRWLVATFIGVTPRSRHLCMVGVEAGLAREARYEWAGTP
jgi:hypothetical protein